MGPVREPFNAGIGLDGRDPVQNQKSAAPEKLRIRNRAHQQPACIRSRRISGHQKLEFGNWRGTMGWGGLVTSMV